MANYLERNASGFLTSVSVQHGIRSRCQVGHVTWRKLSPPPPLVIPLSLLQQLMSSCPVLCWTANSDKWLSSKLTEVVSL